MNKQSDATAGADTPVIDNMSFEQLVAQRIGMHTESEDDSGDDDLEENEDGLIDDDQEPEAETEEEEEQEEGEFAALSNNDLLLIWNEINANEENTDSICQRLGPASASGATVFWAVSVFS